MQYPIEELESAFASTTEAVGDLEQAGRIQGEAH